VNARPGHLSTGASVGAPEGATRWFLVAAGIGFLFWIAFAWFYEFTPKGLKCDEHVAPGQSITPQTRRQMDRMIIVMRRRKD
jgi:hypothetical protein